MKKNGNCPSVKLAFLFFFSTLFFAHVIAQPVINSFAPASGPVGTPVVITGTHFSATASDNIVLFNSIKGVVTQATTSSLTVTVPAGATYGSITVTSQQLTAISSRRFFVIATSCPVINSGSFFPGVEFPTGQYPRGICAGDLDMDGRADLVTANTNSHTISLHRNSSTAGPALFSSAIDLVTGYTPEKVILYDLDGDAKPEIIVTNTFSSSISVFKNLSVAGTLSFAAKVDFTTGNSPADIAAGDLDGDGRIDLAITNLSSYYVSVFKNTSLNGILSFAPRIDYSTNNLHPGTVSIGDLNEDGKPDLAIGTYNNFNDSVLLFRNTSLAGSISFVRGTSIAIDGGGVSLAIGDIDGDNHPDLSVGSFTYNRVSIFRNTGVGNAITFSPRKDFITDSIPVSVFITDVDGDGKADLASTNRVIKAINVFKNNSTAGSLVFAPKVNYPTQFNPTGIAVADFDLNGSTDIALTNFSDESVSLLRRAASQNIFLVDSSKTAVNATPLCSVASSDWNNACRNLQTALNAAREGDQVWVAKGTYFPSVDSTGNLNPADRHNLTFVMKNGVRILGGFSGTETANGQQHSATNKTFLDGEVQTNGVTVKVNNVVWFIKAQSTTVLDGFTIRNGQAKTIIPGGGIYLDESFAVIRNCIISGNSSANAGGGIYMNNSTPSLINCSLHDNAAQYGGAIANYNSSPVIVNCTIAKNSAQNLGGGIYNQSSSPNISNSIVWGNTGLNDTLDNFYSSGGTPLINYSIIGVSPDVFAGTGNKNANPLFIDAMNENFSLLSGSPAIAGGNTSLYPASGPPTDLAGNIRTLNESITIGSYEGGSIPVLNSGTIFINKNAGTIFGNGQSWAKAYSSLSDAVTVSNGSNNVVALWVAKGSYTPTNDSNLVSLTYGDQNSTFNIKRGVRLYGGFSGRETNLSQRDVAANETILDGLSNSRQYPLNVASVIYVSNADSTNLVDGLTILNGTGYYMAYGGGAIAVHQSKLTINNCRILNNAGCGIYNLDGNIKVTKSYFSGNSGSYGGAINNSRAVATVSDCSFISNVPARPDVFGGAISNFQSEVVIERSIFNGNKAVQSGGAIYNDDHSNMTVRNCKFMGNETDPVGRGGAVSNMINSKAVLINCTFLKNFAQAGGALSNYGGLMSVTNCSITNNTAYYGGGGIVNYQSATTNISNSISWGNTSEYDRTVDNVENYDVYTPFGSFNIDHSIIGLVSGVYPGTGNLNTDPKFADTANAIAKLLYNSPAIDAGDNTVYPGDLNSAVDVEGAPRLSGTGIDMGAIEFTNGICIGGAATLTADLTGTAYQWQMNSGSGFIALTNGANLGGTSTRLLQLINIPVTWNGNRFRCLVDGNFSDTLTLQLSNQWQGGVSNAWEDPLNWRCNAVPDDNTDVVIDNGIVVISSNANCSTLTVKAGARVEVKTGAILTIKNK